MPPKDKNTQLQQPSTTTTTTTSRTSSSSLVIESNKAHEVLQASPKPSTTTHHDPRIDPKTFSPTAAKTQKPLPKLTKYEPKPDRLPYNKLIAALKNSDENVKIIKFRTIDYTVDTSTQALPTLDEIFAALDPRLAKGYNISDDTSEDLAINTMITVLDFRGILECKGLEDRYQFIKKLQNFLSYRSSRKPLIIIDEFFLRDAEEYFVRNDTKKQRSLHEAINQNRALLKKLLNNIDGDELKVYIKLAKPEIIDGIEIHVRDVTDFLCTDNPETLGKSDKNTLWYHCVVKALQANDENIKIIKFRDIDYTINPDDDRKESQPSLDEIFTALSKNTVVHTLDFTLISKCHQLQGAWTFAEKFQKFLAAHPESKINKIIIDDSLVDNICDDTYKILYDIYKETNEKTNGKNPIKTFFYNLPFKENGNNIEHDTTEEMIRFFESPRASVKKAGRHNDDTSENDSDADVSDHYNRSSQRDEKHDKKPIRDHRHHQDKDYERTARSPDRDHKSDYDTERYSNHRHHQDKDYGRKDHGRTARSPDRDYKSDYDTERYSDHRHHQDKYYGRTARSSDKDPKSHDNIKHHHYDHGKTELSGEYNDYDSE